MNLTIQISQLDRAMFGIEDMKLLRKELLNIINKNKDRSLVSKAFHRIISCRPVLMNLFLKWCNNDKLDPYDWKNCMKFLNRHIEESELYVNKIINSKNNNKTIL